MSRLSLVGVVLSSMYIFGIVAVFWSDLNQLRDLELNQVGDFFAGIIGPVALLWLILGFFQQGIELRNSVETLKLQASELRNSVEQQKQLVEAARAQFELEAAAHRRELERIESEKFPSLSLLPAGSSSGGGGLRKVKYKLENLGGDIRDLEVSWRSEKLLGKCQKIQVLRKNDSHTFSLVVASDAKPPVIVELKIKYSLWGGSQHKETFRVPVLGVDRPVEYLGREPIGDT